MEKDKWIFRKTGYSNAMPMVEVKKMVAPIPNDLEKASDDTAIYLGNMIGWKAEKVNAASCQEKESEHKNNLNNQNMKQFKKGDILTVESPRGKSTFIFAGGEIKKVPTTVDYIFCMDQSGSCGRNGTIYLHQDVSDIRLSTMEEGKKLFECMARMGLSYDSGKCEITLIEKKWEPKIGEVVKSNMLSCFFIYNGGGSGCKAKYDIFVCDGEVKISNCVYICSKALPTTPEERGIFF